MYVLLCSFPQYFANACQSSCGPQGSSWQLFHSGTMWFLLKVIVRATWLENSDVTNFLFSCYSCDVGIIGEESASLHRREARKEGALGREGTYILACSIQTIALTHFPRLCHFASVTSAIIAQLPHKTRVKCKWVKINKCLENSNPVNSNCSTSVAVTTFLYLEV